MLVELMPHQHQQRSPGGAGVAVVEVETDHLRVRVASPRLVSLHVQEHVQESGPQWISVYPGLWISPPSLRSSRFAPSGPQAALECAR